MSDRINRITVVLEKDFKDEDCEHILNAIRMVKGVLRAEAHVANPDDWMAQQRVRHELGQKLWEILYPPAKPK